MAHGKDVFEFYRFSDKYVKHMGFVGSEWYKTCNINAKLVKKLINIRNQILTNVYKLRSFTEDPKFFED
jgi:hypothetical protein